MRDDKTCILYFSLSPELESKRKNWTDSSKLNLRIARLLHEATLTEIKSSKLPYFIHSEKQQTKTKFGENLVDGIEAVFKQGFENLIVIGNDCPDLMVRDILQANYSLLNNRQSIGRTIDGGCYLFAFSKTQFDSTKFSNLPWCQAKLGNYLLDLMFEAGPVGELETKTDVDFISDLNTLLNQSISRLRQLIRDLFFELLLVVNIVFPKNLILSSASRHRGPPLHS